MAVWQPMESKKSMLARHAYCSIAKGVLTNAIEFGHVSINANLPAYECCNGKTPHALNYLYGMQAVANQATKDIFKTPGKLQAPLQKSPWK